MAKMKKSNLLPFVVTLLVAACGGGGGGGGSSNAAGGVSVSGTAIDGNLYKATAFLDLNDDGVLSVGEPNTTTDANGKFTLSATQDQINSHKVVIVAVPGITIDQDNPNATLTSGFTLMAPAGSPAVVSPLTTHVVAKMNGGLSLADAKSAVQTELGLATVDVMKNYVDMQGSDANYLKAHNVAASIAEVLKTIEVDSNQSKSVADRLSRLSSKVTSDITPNVETIKSATSIANAVQVANIQKTPQSITVTSVLASIKDGASTALTAVLTFADKTTQDITSLVQWVIANVSGDAGGKVVTIDKNASVQVSNSGVLGVVANYLKLSSDALKIQVVCETSSPSSNPFSSCAPSAQKLNTTTALFSTQNLVLPDVNEKAAKTCGDDLLRVNLRIKTANLSKHTDGRRDLIVMISCQTLPYGKATDNPFPSGILAFIQQSDATFVDRTSAVFGSSILATDGVLVTAVANDFNGDGYDDIVISVSSEDGRASYTDVKYRKKQVALTSNGDGTYKSELIGSVTLSEKIKIINNNGVNQLLIAGYGGGIDQAFEYSNNQWKTSSYYTNITGNNPWAGWSSLPLDGSYFSTSNGAVNEGIASDWKNNVYLLSKPTSDSAWSSIDQWSLPSTQSVAFTDWIGSTGTMQLYKINGKDMAFVAFNVSCLVTYSGSSKPTTIFMTNAQQVNGGYKGQSLTQGTSDFIADTTFIALDEVNGKIVQKNVTFTGSVASQLTTNNLQCVDYNGDGKKDIFVSTWGGNPKPIIYIDTDSGAYSLVNQKNFPDNGTGNGIYYSIYEDIDGDGINDLVYFPTQLQTTKVDAIRAFKGLRKISADDLK